MDIGKTFFEGGILAISARPSFSEWLQKKRDERRMSQESVARAAGVSKQYISNLERNAPHPITGAPPMPTLRKVDAIADALQVSRAEARMAAGYAPPDEGDTKPINFELERLGSYYRELPRECQLDVLALTEALWRRRSLEGRAERVAASKTGKHTVEVVRPGKEKPRQKRKSG